MADSFNSRLKRAWNAFNNKEQPVKANSYYEYGLTSYIRPDRVHLTGKNAQSIIASIFNRISVDCSSISLQHIRIDDNGRYLEKIDDGLNYCLTVEANKDQAAKAFVRDVITSMLDEGCVAIVPVDTDINPNISGSFDILSMRTGKITQWYPDKVKVKVYNDRTGRDEEILISKRAVAIIENPFYEMMNEQNSTLQRLIRKLNLLDVVDEQSSSGKLDLIIQLPYTLKTEAQKQLADERRKEIEMQLTGSKYGIAYTNATEHITQLNRPVENNLQKQVEYLTDLLYSQLGITTDILNGSANSDTMNNYYNRTIEPIMSAIVDELKRKFLTKTARTQGQDIQYFRDPFKLVPVSQVAEIADKFTRNEIMSSNEIRQIVGLKPVQDPKADALRNKNLNASEGQSYATTEGQNIIEEPAKQEKQSIVPSQPVLEKQV